jgi:hypothetical protein
MAQRIVDLLEAIDVEGQKRERRCPAPGGGKRLAQPLDERRPIGQSGELVGAGKVQDLGLGRLALGDIDQQPFQLDQPPRRVADGRKLVFDPAVVATACQQAKFGYAALIALVEDMCQRFN